MKFGHQFTRTIEATHPTISDKVGGENRKEPRLEPRFFSRPAKTALPNPTVPVLQEAEEVPQNHPEEDRAGKKCGWNLKTRRKAQAHGGAESICEDPQRRAAEVQ